MENALSALASIDAITWWIIGFVAAGIGAGVVTGYLRAKKIQPKGFKWKHFRREVMWGILNVTISAALLGSVTPWLQSQGVIQLNDQPASL